MNLRISGPCFGQSGYERITRGMVIALDKLGVHVQLIPYTNWNDEWCDLDSEDRMRLERMCRQEVSPTEPVLVAQFPDPARDSLIRDSKMRICYTLFETDRCPSYWRQRFAEAKISKVWTFSRFNYDYWTQDGLPADRMDIMPFGIDTDLFSSEGDRAEIKNRKKFMFLTNGDFTERKNFEGLVEAFVTEFSGKDDVCLVVKTHFGGFTRQHKEACKRKLKDIVMRFNPTDPPLVLFCGDKLADSDMPLLYRAADCFVLASRGEGLGLIYAEAMACGVPCIASNFGGMTDFITEKNGWLVPCEIRTIDDTEYIRKCLVALNHKWAHPDMTALKSYMQFAYMNPDICKEKGRQGREDIEKYTWQKCGLWIVKKIIEATA